MSLNNENNPLLITLDLGSPATDLLLPAIYAQKAMKVTGAWLLNGAGISASDTDFVQLELKNGSNVVAELDTRAAHEGAVTANVGKGLNVDSTYEDVAAGDTLTVNYNETDSGTNVALTNGKLVVALQVK